MECCLDFSLVPCRCALHQENRVLLIPRRLVGLLPRMPVLSVELPFGARVAIHRDRELEDDPKVVLYRLHRRFFVHCSPL